MKGKELMDIVIDARSRWQDTASEITQAALVHLTEAASFGNTHVRFLLNRDSARINRHVIHMARQELREEGIKLSYHIRERAFTVSIDQRAVANYRD